MNHVAFLSPTFPDPELVAADYAAIVESGIFTNGGPNEREFTAALAAWIGGGVSVSVTSSATSGLQLACAASFHRGRRYVLVPSFTFAAGPLVIRWCGFEPLFIDIRSDSWQPDAVAAEHVLRERSDEIAGILLTTTFGVANGEIDSWEALAKRYELPLVIDSAAGFGSAYPSGEPLGARGHCEVFSMHATKTLAVGEGGAVSSRDHALIAAVERLKNFGFDSSRQSIALGTNAKLSELSSAIGLRQLAVLPRRLSRRQAVLARYIEQLERLGIQFQPAAEWSAVPFVSALLPNGPSRDSFMSALQAAGIECRSYYNPPLHLHAVFSDARRVGDLAVTEDIAARIISLPIADDLPIAVIDTIAVLAGGALDIGSRLR